MHNAPATIVHYLNAGTTEWDAYCPWLPDGYTNTYSAVVFRPISGGNDAYSPFSAGGYEFRCFGGSNNIQDSWTVYGQLFDLLYAANCDSSTHGTVIRAYESNGGQPLIDPDTEYRFVTTTFEIATRGN